jgi:cyclopropane-fatty-acyl-phospholipid synthase
MQNNLPRETWIQRKLLAVARRTTRTVPMEFAVGTGGPAAQEPGIPVVRLQDTRSLFALLLNPQMNFGDLYSEGRLVIEGDMVSLLEDLYRLPDRWRSRASARLLGWFHPNTLRGSRRNIHHHYDIPTDFHQLYLDPDLVYTCAYFPNEDTSLHDAQLAKMDHVCRKLWLRRGETVVEAGCGWGALAIHMARNYGVHVKAYNISHEQIEFARSRARREGLGSAVEFIEDDYRNINGRFDVFVSVGMLEHVGRSHYQELGAAIRRAIGDTGRGLLHFIGRNRWRPLNPWIRRRIFPGGYPPVLSEALALLEPHDYSVLDVENLRLHYAKTLEHWLANYEHNIGAVVQRFGIDFARMWRLYLAGSIAGFRAGTLQLFQVLFAGRECAAVPWTRAYLYQQAAPTISPRKHSWTPATS